MRASFLERAAAPVPEDDAPEARDPRTGDVVRPKRAADDAKGPSEEARASPFPAIDPDAFEASVLASPIGQLVLFTRLGDAKCARVSAAVGEALRKKMDDGMKVSALRAHESGPL